MSKGRVKLVGSPTDLASYSEFSAHTALSPSLPVQNQKNSIEFSCEAEDRSCQGNECIQISEEAEEILELEERKEGKVELFVYRSANSLSLLFVYVLCVL